jgi:hypothetical protein
MTITINGTGTGCFTDASGNVGIGTATPTARLQATTATAAANFRFDGNNFAGGNYYGSSVNTTGVFTGLDSAGNFAVNVRDAGAITFSTTNTEQARISSAGVLSFNSGYGSSAIAYGCRAWVNYNGNTPAIRASGGITSVTKNSAGNYTLNFSFTMPDANYAPVFGTNSWTTTDPGGDRNVKIVTNGTNIGNGTASLMSTTQLQIIEGNTAAGTDHVYTCVAIFR